MAGERFGVIGNTLVGLALMDAERLWAYNRRGSRVMQPPDM